MPSYQLVQHALLGLTFLFLAGSFFRKDFFACAYLLIMMNRPGLYYPLIGQIRFELIVAIWAIVLLAMEWDSLISLKDNQIVRNMWAFLLVILVSMLQAFSFSVAWDWVYEIVFPNTLITLLVLLFCKDRKDIGLFLWVFILASVGLGYEAVYRYVTGDVVGLHAAGIGGFQYAVAEVGRATNHNALANYFLSAMPLLWFIGIGSKKMLVKMSAFGLLAFSFAGVLISGSRGGMVGLVVILIVMALLSKQPGLFLVGGVVLLILSIPVMGGEYLARMATILDFGGSDLSSSSRIDGLVHGIEMMIKRPILGVGPGCYPVARKAWMEWSLWAHNHYGQLAGELGVIGVVVWCRFAKDYMRRSWQFIKTKDADPWLKNIASAVFVTSILRLALGMFDHSLYRFVWFMLAAIVVHLEMTAEKSKKKDGILPHRPKGLGKSVWK